MKLRKVRLSCLSKERLAELSILVTATAASKPADKDNNDLDAVAGNAEDDIGDLIANIREKELLYGNNSLLAIYGTLVAQICASPKAYKVIQLSCVVYTTC
jgi:hypothetical protein